MDQSGINLQNVGYFSRFSFPVIHIGVHLFKLMEQPVIFREPVIVLYGLRNVPVLHQGPVE